MQRRHFLSAAGAATLAAMVLPRATLAKEFEVTRTEAEWRAMLTNAQYKVMRDEGTERADHRHTGHVPSLVEHVCGDHHLDFRSQRVQVKEDFEVSFVFPV